MTVALFRAVWSIIQPSSALALLLVLGAVLLAGGHAQRGKRLLVAGAILYPLLGFSPLANWLMIPLEGWVAKPPASELRGIAGIIVLGGSFDTLLSRARGQPQLNDQAERMIEAARLALAMPDIPVIFSGGTSPSLYEQTSESDAARQFFAGFGIREPRLELENRSRNTIENAAFTAELLHPKPGQRWLLITSAFHMPRAKALFEARGFRVVPWPVAYTTRGRDDLWRVFSEPADGLRHLDLAIKEWASLCLTWLRGGISPGERDSSETALAKGGEAARAGHLALGSAD